MKRMRPQPSGDFSDHNNQPTPDIDTAIFPLEERKDLLQLEALLELGFSWDEASKLLHLREHFYNNIEVQQRMADDNHLLFARWLFEHGEMNEHEC